MIGSSDSRILLLRTTWPRRKGYHRAGVGVDLVRRAREAATIIVPPVAAVGSAKVVEGCCSSNAMNGESVIILEPLEFFADFVFALSSSLARDYCTRCTSEVQNAPGRGDMFRIGEYEYFGIVLPMPGDGSFAYIYRVTQDRRVPNLFRVRPVLVRELVTDVATTQRNLPLLVPREMRALHHRRVQ